MLASLDRIVRAARESSQSVVEQICLALRSLDARVDVVLFFQSAGGELHCAGAFGARSGGYAGLTIRTDHPRWLVAEAARARHHVRLRSVESALVPGDRAALAIPMSDDGEAIAVVYVSSRDARALTAAEAAIALVGHACTPYALARDRERDRNEAMFDGLTGLLGPRAFRSALRAHVERAPGLAALWFIDTDGFKEVNDRLGHARGDLVLQEMASLVRAHCVPHVDVPARNGGDEFCVLLPGTQKASAIVRARSFVEAVRAHEFVVRRRVTASVGVAAIPFDARDAAGLLEIADAAMYHSKRAGRDRVSFVAEGRFAEFL